MMKRLINPAVVVLLAYIASSGPSKADQDPAPWVVGTITSVDGKPVVGATITVSTVYGNGFRLVPTTTTVTTDANGRYAVWGADLDATSDVSLFVSRSGLIPAIGWFPLRRQYETLNGARTLITPRNPVPVRDFVMAKVGGDLEVTVIADGKPVSGVDVSLLRSDGAFSTVHCYQGSEAANAIYKQMRTDKKGIVRFDQLVPGAYLVNATRPGFDEGLPDIVGDIGIFGDGKGVGIADVTVRAGATTAFRKEICDQPKPIEYESIGADGSPDPVTPSGPGYRRIHDASSSFVEADKMVAGRRSFVTNGRGFWAISESHDSSWGNCFPPRTLDPVPAVTGWVAVSSLLNPRSVPAFRSRPVHMASIDVRAVDLSGRPATGRALLTRFSYFGDRTAELDKAGRACFPTVEPGEFALCVGKPEDFLTPGVSPLPSDSELLSKPFYTAVHLSVDYDQKQLVELSQVAAGYLRGRLKTARQSDLSSYAIYPDQFAGPQSAVIDCKTGEFVAGPFQTGPVRLHVGVKNRSAQNMASIRADVVGGSVVRIADVDAADISDRFGHSARSTVSFGSGVFNPFTCDQIGRVFESDGKTPVMAARAVYFAEETYNEEPTGEGLTDAAGSISLHGNCASNPAHDAPSTPIMLAFAPGRTGATIVDLAHMNSGPLTIVLPRPIAVRGIVTVGGKSIAGLHGQMRIVAAYQGRGKANETLSLWTTPQDDGSFELGGLTPGRYLVQAAIDGIWVSDSVVMEVTGYDPADLKLNVGEPGGPIAVTVLDEAGKPVVGHGVTVDRPRGPLTDRDWPTEFFTDGAGVAYIPAIERGEHVVHVDNQTAKVVAPPATCDGPATVIVKLPR